jgi:hypothetical protein
VNWFVGETEQSHSGAKRAAEFIPCSVLPKRRFGGEGQGLAHERERRCCGTFSHSIIPESKMISVLK